MLRALSHPERQVLLAHERAHASGLHYLFTTAAALPAVARPCGGLCRAESRPCSARHPQPRLLLLVATVLLVAVAGASALEAVRELHGLLDYARAVGPP